MVVGADGVEFERLLLKRVVEEAIGPSALRNQGSRDVVARARSYCAMSTTASLWWPRLTSSSVSSTSTPNGSSVNFPGAAATGALPERR